ncbi:MAG: hypothetical protein ACRDRO_04605 [Pseudonocardiaceae bacterium]
MPYAVAGVSDGSALAHQDPTSRAGSVAPALRHWAALIHEHTGLPTRPMYVAAQDAEDLSAGLRGLSPDIGVIVLICTDPAHYSAANGSAPGWGSQRPVVTDSAMAAAAATAALLTTLNRRGLSPERSRVVIAGATTMPVLRSLLLAAGLGRVISWDRRDTVTFPLHRIIRNAEAVIDLLGCARELAEIASDNPELIIITPDKASWALLALPALLHAVATAQDPTAGVKCYHACALALAANTPPDRQLPDPMEPALPSTVEQTATRAPSPARSCESVDPYVRAGDDDDNQEPRR